MNYYIQCPKCGQIIEVNYKPITHKCRICGTAFKVTKANSAPKVNTGVLCAIALAALFIGAQFAGRAFRGYSPESHIIIALAWIFAAFGTTLLVSWYERETERRLQHECGRGKARVSRKGTGSMQGYHNGERN